MPNQECLYFPDCGGCDFLDLETQQYRQKKEKLLQENLSKLETLQPKLIAEAQWLWIEKGSRRKITLQIDANNNLGFFAKKSHKIIAIESCSNSEAELSQLILVLRNFIKKQDHGIFTQISLTLFDNGVDAILSGKKTLNFAQNQKLIAFAKDNNINLSYRQNKNLEPIFLARKNQIFYSNFKIDLTSDIFIQATKKGLEKISQEIREFLQKNSSIKKVADIYSGFGAYTFGIIDLVSSVSAFEGAQEMVDLIEKNSAANNFGNKIVAQKRDLFSNPLNKKELSKFDLAIINPPRNGASPQIKEIGQSTLKNLLYVSCNPQTFARDAEILIGQNFKISKLVILDQFYKTAHLELVAVFQK